MAAIHDSVSEYYGKILQKSKDLKTNACTTSGAPPKHIRDVVSMIHPEVEGKYYGCGLVVPSVLEGMRILDLGSGSGRDCFILSKLVGETGYVLGVDMTTEQIETAQKYIEYHTQKFGYSKPNIEFKKGFIEKLNELGLKDNSFDIIISNCVINLSPDKDAVLREAFRVLKHGGELYFSDVYSDRKVPKELMDNSVLWGECLSGALYWNDFLNLSKKIGFRDPRLVSDTRITISNKNIEELCGHIKFFSATYRLFKIDDLEPACEDYGQAVIYKGGIDNEHNVFKLDGHHLIEKGRVFPVCGNTFKMLKHTRFEPYFVFIGDQTTHFGIFAGCGTGIPYSSANATNGAAANASCCG